MPVCIDLQYGPLLCLSVYIWQLQFFLHLFSKLFSRTKGCIDGLLKTFHCQQVTNLQQFSVASGCNNKTINHRGLNFCAGIEPKLQSFFFHRSEQKNYKSLARFRYICINPVPLLHLELERAQAWARSPGFNYREAFTQAKEFELNSGLIWSCSTSCSYPGLQHELNFYSESK